MYNINPKNEISDNNPILAKRESILVKQFTVYSTISFTN